MKYLSIALLRTTSLASIVLISLLDVVAQDMNAPFLQVIPPSPDVAALGKYGDIPIGHYTGIPSISVPLYNTVNGDLTLALSLDYHAGGIKVEEIASRVGLSWSLNAGGIITRSVRGLPDDMGLWEPKPISERIENIMLTGSQSQRDQLAKDVEGGLKDGESDIYYFNFNNHSGKFIYDQAGIPHIVPQANLLITKFGAGWKIVDEAGISYYFNVSEQVSSASCSGDQSVYAAWFLTRIESVDGVRNITLTYTPVSYSYAMYLGQTRYFSINAAGASCFSDPPPCLGTETYYTQRLSKIDFEQGYVNFNYLTSRCDLIGDKSLDEIVLFDRNNVQLKKFNLAYSYFGNDGFCNQNTSLTKRLKLLSVTELNNQVSKPPHSFTYNETVSLPSRFSYARDFWGYYNGQLNNTTLIPSFTTTHYNGSSIYYELANRNTNAATAQAAILTSIKYPTGGETRFTYESNRISDDRFEPDYESINLFYSVNGTRIGDLIQPLNVTPVQVPAGGGFLNFNNISGFDAPWPSCDGVEAWLTKDGVPFQLIGNSLSGTTSFYPAGIYSLSFVFYCPDDVVVNFNITIVAKFPIYSEERNVGGLRIKKIEDLPATGLNPIVRNIKYNLEADPLRSSGFLTSFPDYGYDHNVVDQPVDSQGKPQGLPKFCNYRVKTSFTNYPLATTKGGFVGYSHVIEDYQENGEIRHSFIAYADQTTAFPFPPSDNFDWRRGFLESTKVYRNESGQKLLIREINNFATELNESRVFGIKVGRNWSFLFNGALYQPAQDLPIYSFYHNASLFHALSKTVERIYDQSDPTKFIEDVTEYFYSPQHLQLKSISTRRGNAGIVAEETIKSLKYALDYTFLNVPIGSEAMGIKKLQDLHFASAVIEETYSKQLRDISSNQITNKKIIGSKITTYKSDKPYPSEIYRLEISNPIMDTGFGIGSTLIGNGFVKNTSVSIGDNYKSLIQFTEYDNYGNILSQRKSDDIAVSYLWGYDNRYPIAQITGVENRNDIAYTSFESLSPGNWNFENLGVTSESATGNSSFDLTGRSITKFQLDISKAYILSYRQKSNQVVVSGGTQSNIETFLTAGQWDLVARKITGASSLSISGSTKIDELRLYPIGTKMITYTHDPLVGFSSVIDENCLATSFKYDPLQRLISIKDNKGSLLKSYIYNYKLP